MLFKLKNIIFIIIVSFIYSYISFPLFINERNLSSMDTPKQFIEKLKSSESYIMINIGSQKANVKCYLNNYITELMIAGEGVRNHKYNESNSESYNCTYCINKEYSDGWYKEGVISTEDFYVQNNVSEMGVVHKMKFILAKYSIFMDPPEGICGLQLPKFGSDPDYNLIRSLKKANVTNSYNWFLDYNSFQNGSPKMIIDAFPHDLYNKKYNSEKFITSKAISLNVLYNYPIWALQFSDIYYNNIKMDLSSKDSKLAIIQFDFGIIVAPNETGIILEQQFFEKYYNENICFKNSLSIETFIYCKKNKFDIKKFKSIYLKNVEMNIIFELSYEDLFYSSNEYIFFLIIFRRDGNWIFGELFLKKYYLTYNQDDKTIGYYQGMEKKIEDEINNNDNKNQFSINLTHILLLIIIIILIIIGIIIYTKKGNRKKRANELNDDYEYTMPITEPNEGKKIIE